jgi:hypothetical protein
MQIAVFIANLCHGEAMKQGSNPLIDWLFVSMVVFALWAVVTLSIWGIDLLLPGPSMGLWGVVHAEWQVVEKIFPKH